MVAFKMIRSGNNSRKNLIHRSTIIEFRNLLPLPLHSGGFQQQEAGTATGFDWHNLFPHTYGPWSVNRPISMRPDESRLGRLAIVRADPLRVKARGPTINIEDHEDFEEDDESEVDDSDELGSDFEFADGEDDSEDFEDIDEDEVPHRRK